MIGQLIGMMPTVIPVVTIDSFYTEITNNTSGYYTTIFWYTISSNVPLEQVCLNGQNNLGNVQWDAGCFAIASGITVNMTVRGNGVKANLSAYYNGTIVASGNTVFDAPAAP